MNIFYLSEDPEEAARWHNDRHVVKMVTEYAQILCTVRHLHGQEAPYRKTHAAHPAVVWAAESRAHWLWLHKLAVALYAEYRHRYGGKVHKAGEVIAGLEPPEMPDTGFREPPQAMPEAFRQPSAVEAYRAYYRHGKAHLATWKHREPPAWFAAAEG